MESFFSFIIIAGAIVGICVMLYTILLAVKDIKSGGTSKFQGMALSVWGTVGDITREQVKVKGGVMSTINHFAVCYEVGGVQYAKPLALTEVHKDIKPGDTIELYYDSADPQRAVMADGSEVQSGKNSIKLSIAYIFIIMIVAAVLFFSVQGTL